MKASKFILSIFGSILFYFFAKYLVSRGPTLMQAVFLASVMMIGLLIVDLEEFIERVKKGDFKHIFVKLFMMWIFGFVGAVLLIYCTPSLALIGIVLMSLLVTWVNHLVTGS
ncbi:MAG TPA: hypothetical protein EYH24_06195 [Thermococcus paralvinellae]|uniref:Uncharacterized protein n=1 Tax=Thermococcus paralvinellae TaxID=582419 RepID=A0A832ZG09_9EURY|nr:hypothetical protein [Thermococcus paralvinellae]HIP89503.1 hypothetical protein [Thermococcus paralvinellae]